VFGVLGLGMIGRMVFGGRSFGFERVGHVHSSFTLCRTIYFYFPFLF
jgi:hypothetical protein